MKDQEYIDDLTLNAFVDGELDAGNCETIIHNMETDADLRNRVYRLRRAKDLMQLGFSHATPASIRTVRQQGRWQLFTTRFAASLAVLAIGVGAGMIGERHLGSLAKSDSIRMAGTVQQQSEKVILHISKSDPVLFLRAMDYTERFLKEHESRGNEIEVVAHASGLDLLRDDISPLRERVLGLINQYNNVHFIACADSIRMLRDKGTSPAIILGVSTDVPAFEHIIERLQGGGWKYIKVEALPTVVNKIHS
jgi:intracellular sulfur oxidation DsrE/DsrF family protein